MQVAVEGHFGKNNIMSLKILFIHQKYSPISAHVPMDGSATCTIELAEYLQKQGFNVTIAGILLEKETYIHNGVKYYHLGNNYNIDHHFRLLGEENFEVIQVIRGDVLKKVSEYFPGAKKIVRLGDIIFSAHEVSPSLINELADEVIAVSIYVKESAIKWGINEQKITIVPVGIRTDIFRRLPEIYREKNLLVFAGATIKEKGIHLLLKGFLGILTSFPDAKLEVYGATSLWGRKKEEIPWKAIEQKNSNIFYKGKESKKKLSYALNRSILCVVPSLIPEGFSRVSIEAQACGCPVVCAAAGGLPETIIDGETGIIVNHLTHDNLVAVLINLLSDTDCLQAMSIKAAEHAKRFSVENTAYVFKKMIE